MDDDYAMEFKRNLDREVMTVIYERAESEWLERASKHLGRVLTDSETAKVLEVMATILRKVEACVRQSDSESRGSISG